VVRCGAAREKSCSAIEDVPDSSLSERSIDCTKAGNLLGKVENGKITRYHVDAKVTFVVQWPQEAVTLGRIRE